MPVAASAGRALLASLVVSASAVPAPAQSALPPLYASDADLARCTDFVVPGARSFPIWPAAQGLSISQVRASVKILEETASTTLEVELVNRGNVQSEAVLLLPVPEDAAVSGFGFDGPAPEPTARILPRDEARRLYDSIVARIKDPALLEFAGTNLVRSSVFPIAPGAKQRVRLTYEHLLARDGARIDYVLPRSESLTHGAPWAIDVEVRSNGGVATVYSPSHELRVRRESRDFVRASVTAASATNPGAFRLSFLRNDGDLAASLFAYPDGRCGGGYFLLVAAPPKPEADARPRPREVTLVIDRSGSMAGPKMDQARTAALQVVEGLSPADAFNVIDYSTTVAQFAAGPVAATREQQRAARRYLEEMRPSGGTNLYDALNEALRQPHDASRLPIVLFLTDGIPTVRTTSEAAIRELVEKGNPHQRRVFTFGVGSDVNAPLLDRIADVTRASTTYVLPGEDVEVKVGEVDRRLRGPLLSDLRVEVLGRDGEVDTRRVRDLVPAQIPDCFEGDSLVLLGRYVGEGPLDLRVTGASNGRTRDFRFHFELSRATTRNAFVPRLWATRRIAFLVDQVREMGATLSIAPPGRPSGVLNDPRFRELSEEILRLSTEFGVLTEYTSFLATDGADLGNWRELTKACGDNLNEKAVGRRVGDEAVAQGCNYNDRKGKGWQDYRNTYVDAKLDRVEVADVQQVCDRTFF
ncbi:MAG TPA: VIT and VWA domain-containing protein, partial [Planctomycetota bacterium]|nr:VIT and VWA domain-containing protein [Planctomycetota bacterium]